MSTPLAPTPALPSPEPEVSITPGTDQPLRARLKKGSELHQKIIARLRSRLEMSRRAMTDRYEAFDEADDNVRQYVDITRKARRGDKTTDTSKRELPFERSIKIPVSRVIHETRKTQLVSLFLHRDPPLHVEGRAPEDVTPAKLLEAVLAYDCQQMNFPLVMYSLIQDADKYGMGILYDTWDVEYGYKRKVQTVNTILGPIEIPSTEWGLVKEFNRWESVDPYCFWPDPRVSLSNIQEAEFVGHRIYRGQSHLLERKMDESGQNGVYFNVDEALKSGKGVGGETRASIGRARFGLDDFTLADSADDKDKGFFAIDHIQIKVVPKDWELGPGTRPEIWWFTVVNEGIIIRAHKSGYEHMRFTYAVAESNPDPHTNTNQGIFEDLDGIQRVSDWLWNSRIENVRKILNDSLILTPSMLEMGDILNPGPARHIRLSQLGEEAVANRGVDPGLFARQLSVQDVTGTHAEIGAFLLDQAQRLGASNDPAQGATTPEKKTLGEVQSLMAASSQRIAMLARIIDSTCLAPTARRSVSNRQQFTTLEQYYRVTGDLAKMEETRGMQRLLINRESIFGDFDYMPQTGIIPADPARQSELWARVLEMIGANPQLAAPGPDNMAISPRLIFGELVRTAGLRNMQDFMEYVQPQPMPPEVVPDEYAQQQTQAGNYVPADQMPPPPVA